MLADRFQSQAQDARDNIEKLKAEEAAAKAAVASAESTITTNESTLTDNKSFLADAERDLAKRTAELDKQVEAALAALNRHKANVRAEEVGEGEEVTLIKDIADIFDTNHLHNDISVKIQQHTEMVADMIEAVNTMTVDVKRAASTSSVGVATSRTE